MSVANQATRHTIAIFIKKLVRQTRSMPDKLLHKPT